MIDGTACDGDYVEAGFFRVGAGAAEVIAGGSAKGLDFFGINVTFGRAVVGGNAGFNFDEYGAVVFPGDEVDFAAALWGAPVSGDYDETFAAEVAMGEIFAATTDISVATEPQTVGEPGQGGQQVQTRTPWLCRG